MTRSNAVSPLFELASMTAMQKDVSLQLSALCPFRTLAEYAQMGIWRSSACDSEFPDVELMEGQFVLRREFRKNFGYVVATAEVMTVLAGLLREMGPVLDAGCGSGYLSKELARLGVITFAVDWCDFGQARPSAQGYPINAVYQRDALGDAAAYVSARFGAVLLTWPPYGQPFALRVAQAMLPGQWLVYEGEDAGGCTADDAFFDFMADSRLWESLPDASCRLNAVHVTLDTLHDHWKVWKRLA